LLAQGLRSDDTPVVFSPHLENRWSMVISSSVKGLWGEMVEGSLHQLTQGVPSGTPSFRFVRGTRGTWIFSSADLRRRHLVERAVRQLFVKDKVVRQQLSEIVGATFSGGLLCGYFETVV